MDGWARVAGPWPRHRVSSSDQRFATCFFPHKGLRLTQALLVAWLRELTNNYRSVTTDALAVEMTPTYKDKKGI